MATLQDIADRVGVSSMTVSRALRGKVGLKRSSTAALVRRIHEVAEEVGYTPDWKAKAFRSGRTQLIGLLEADLPESHWHDPRMIAGLVEELQRDDYSLVLVRLAQGRDQYLDARFDGLLLDHVVHDEELGAIQRAGLPSLLVNAPPYKGLDSIMLDHREAGRLAGAHLVGLGHRRIANLRQSVRAQRVWPQHACELWRLGLGDALASAGEACQLIDMVPEVESDDPLDEQANYWPVMQDLFGGPDRPTAVVSDCTKRSVEAVLANLTRLGLRCPGDVSVLNMQDEESGGWVTPALTAIDMPYRALGRAAARRLLSAIAGDADGPASPDLRPDLVARASTGPAATPPSS